MTAPFSPPSPSYSSLPSQRIPRSRTGCWACRARSVKCDETRPRCRRCQRSKLNCQYGIRLQWVEDSIAQGICHGRQGVWSAKENKDDRDTFPARWAPNQDRSSQTHFPRPVYSVEEDTFFLNTFCKDLEWYSSAQADPHSGSPRLVCPEQDEDRPETPCVARSRKRKRFHDTTRPKPTTPIQYPVGSSAGLAASPTQLDGYVLDYYNQVVCSNTCLIDDQVHNPFRFLLLPMASTSKTILAAILAVGASKLSYKEPHFRYRALIHRQRVLADLQKSLNIVQTERVQNLEALMAAIMLCWYDISDFCRKTWTSHIAGISCLLDICTTQSNGSADADTLIRFGRQYLVYHVIMAKATFHLEGVLPITESLLSRLLQEATGIVPTNFIDVNISQSSSNGMHVTQQLIDAGSSTSAANCNKPSAFTDANNCQDYVNCNMGFSNSLLTIINHISNLADMEFSDEKGPGSISKVIASIEWKLEILVQLAPDSIEPPSFNQALGVSPDSPTTHRNKLELIMATAEANRLTAFLFLDEVCETEFPDQSPNCRRHRIAHIQKILSLAETICELGPVTAALPIWPVFVAACMSTVEEDRLRVLKILDHFQSHRHFGSVPPASAAIEMIWRQRDLKSDENARKIASTVLSNGKLGDRRKLKKLLRTKLSGRPARYSWEKAIFMLDGTILSLT